MKDKSGQYVVTKIYEPENYQEKLAVVTHYLKNSEQFEDHVLKQDALKYLDEIIRYVYPESKSCKDITDSATQYSLFPDLYDVPFASPVNPQFTFIDLFAGIGGFRIAMQNLGGKCVFSSEWDEQAQRTYQANFGEVPFGDITKEHIKKYIPADFDMLCAGFPCQSFSIAGKRGGFEDTRGTLFFDVADIIREKQPKMVILENVKGLKSHDHGKTLDVILNTLRFDLNYVVPEPKILNAKNFGLPQNRERIYIVGFRKDLEIKGFMYPEGENTLKRIRDIKEKESVNIKYFISARYLKSLDAHKERHAAKGNGFGYVIIDDDQVSNTIMVGGMGHERNFIIDQSNSDYLHTSGINQKAIRKMTPREWARLQGFPDEFKIIVSDASAYKQFGNTVAIPVVEAIGRELLIQKDLYEHTL